MLFSANEIPGLHWPTVARSWQLGIVGWGQRITNGVRKPLCGHDRCLGPRPESGGELPDGEVQAIPATADKMGQGQVAGAKVLQAVGHHSRLGGVRR